jgi:hypothetical protein
MKNSELNKKLIRQYLLGKLGEEQRQAIEERLITDREYMEETLIVESELFDDYVNDDLSEGDQKKFDKHLLSTPMQMQKLEFAKALVTYTGVEAAANSPPIPEKVHQSGKRQKLTSKKLVLYFSLAAVILIALAASFIVYKVRTQPDQRTPLELEVAEINSEEHQRAEDISKTLIVGPLKPWLVRESGEMKKITILSTTEIVQLRLNVMANGYQSYQVVLQTGEGQEIFTLGNLKPRVIENEAVVLLNVPARILTRGDYQLDLNGLNTNGRLERAMRYTFRVIDNYSPKK